MSEFEHKNSYEKKIIRKFLLNRRSELSSLFETKNKAHIHLKPLLKDHQCVGSYVSFRNELNTELIHDMLNNQKITKCLPSIDEKNRNMQFKKYDEDTSFIVNKYGIKEPDPKGKNIKPSIILVPLLAFNDDGYRIGYGGGFYDKYINSNKDITKVGVGFTFQEYKNLPIEPHDEKLDWILTEKYLYKV
tara:strand:- start:460 stop:1026 length:567 start_codon:yes stop_codon:yes gene_type:complete